MDYILVYTTFPNEGDAAAVARRVIEKRLASCVNIFPGARSFHNWEGKVQDVQESIMILKTRKDLWSSLRTAIEAGHSYEVPAIVALNMEDANPLFLQWVDEQTNTLAAAKSH